MVISFMMCSMQLTLVSLAGVSMTRLFHSSLHLAVFARLAQTLKCAANFRLHQPRSPISPIPRLTDLRAPCGPVGFRC